MGIAIALHAGCTEQPHQGALNLRLYALWVHRPSAQSSACRLVEQACTSTWDSLCPLCCLWDAQCLL
eukprot:5701578-Amphidinium_carterae.2